MAGGSLPGDQLGTLCWEHDRTRGEWEGRRGRGGDGRGKSEGGMAGVCIDIGSTTTMWLMGKRVTIMRPGGAGATTTMT
jgi:hypothetical protein